MYIRRQWVQWADSMMRVESSLQPDVFISNISVISTGVLLPRDLQEQRGEHLTSYSARIQMPFRGFVCKPEMIPVCVPLLILCSKIWAHNKMSGYSALQRSPDSCSSGRRIRHQSIKRKGQTQTFPHKTDDTNNLVEYSTSGICHRVTTSGSITQQKEMSCIVSTASSVWTRRIYTAASMWLHELW